MAFVRVDTIELVRTGRSKHLAKRVIVCTCDQCGKEFTRKYTKKNADAAMTHPRFCSNFCTFASKKRGGIMYEKIVNNLNREKIRKTLLERYGVTNPGQLPDHNEKCKKTLRKHYNVDCVFNIPYVYEKIRNSGKRQDVIEKRKKTCLEKYGAENVYASEYGKKKIQNTLMQRYSVSKVGHIHGIIEKRKNTVRNRYSCNNIFQRHDIQNKARQTIHEKYGTYTFWQSKKHKEHMRSHEWITRVHETMKRNGTYRKSKPEEKCYELLCSKFGIENVERQVRINNWSIDFYVKTIDIYIQLDGVYWHGLDRKLTEILKFKNPRDVVIHQTYERDQNQINWFKKHNMRLLRITDKMSTSEINALLKLIS